VPGSSPVERRAYEPLGFRTVSDVHVYEWSPARDDRDASSVTTSRGDRRTHLDSSLGTSVRMIEKHYATLIDGARAGIVSRLDALDAALRKATARRRPGAARAIIARGWSG
jgi:hypothetical protein